MKIAIVTGASSGMGRECVRWIDRRYQSIQEIWVIARRRERLEELSREVKKPLRLFAMDLTREDSIRALREALEKSKPNVKLLVNSAGYGKIGLFTQIPFEDQQGMAALNCQALLAVTHVTLPFMAAKSRILQFASAAAFLPQPKFSVYAATKAFVLSFTRALRQELKGREIYVTAVCPGPVHTEFFDVAETTGHVSLYKKHVMAEPKKVVAKAFRDLERKKALSIYGLEMKALCLISKILPQSWLIWFMARL